MIETRIEAWQLTTHFLGAEEAQNAISNSNNVPSDSYQLFFSSRSSISFQENQSPTRLTSSIINLPEKLNAPPRRDRLTRALPANHNIVFLSSSNSNVCCKKLKQNKNQTNYREKLLKFKSDSVLLLETLGWDAGNQLVMMLLSSRFNSFSRSSCWWVISTVHTFNLSRLCWLCRLFWCSLCARLSRLKFYILCLNEAA